MNENHIGDRVRQQLNLGLKLKPAVLEGLREGRQRALSRQSALQTSPFMALAGNVLGGVGFTAVPQFVLALLLLFAGYSAIDGWQQAQNIKELEVIDTAVLSDDLPIDAYLDKGFDAWLKQSSL